MGMTIPCFSCGMISSEPICYKCQSERRKQIKEISNTTIPTPQNLLGIELSEEDILLQKAREFIIKKLKSDFIGNSLEIRVPFNSNQIDSYPAELRSNWQ